MKTPKQVEAIANKYNRQAEYIHNIDGFEVFSLVNPGEDDTPAPTGLPFIVIFKDGVARIIDGNDAFDWL